MAEKLRLAVVAILLVLVVLVDFTGKLMSIAADGVLVGLAIYFAQPLLKNRSDRRGPPALDSSGLTVMTRLPPLLNCQNKATKKTNYFNN